MHTTGGTTRIDGSVNRGKTLPEVSRSRKIIDVQVFREDKLRRTRRQLATVANAVRAGRSRAKSLDPTKPIDGETLVQVLGAVGADVQLIKVPVNRPPWTTTPIEVSTGYLITWLAWGYVDLVKPLGARVGPSTGFLCRVHDGRPQESGRDTGTFTADRSGAVEVACRFPGWVQDDGSIAVDRVPHRLPYRAMTGELTVVLVRWAPETDPGTALTTVVSKDESGLCRAEIERLMNPPKTPPGWHPHPSTGREEIWSADAHAVGLDCNDSGGIIRHPADTPLTPMLRLRWSWRVHQLPSQLPEDTKITHDYLSIALEFDDGQDLTWHWSSALPEGFAYRCPFDYWRKLETHVVVRTGPSDLGRWIDEEVDVFAHHQAAIGGRVPARVVNVWLIGVSFVQGGRARAEFRDINLIDGDSVLHIS